MKVLVTGSRKWTNRSIIGKAMLLFPKDTIFLHGDAIGADRIAKDIAIKNGYKQVPYPVTDWHNHQDCTCKASALYCYQAGKRRNSVMLAQKPDLVLAFKSVHSTTKGTDDTINKAKALNIPIRSFSDE